MKKTIAFIILTAIICCFAFSVNAEQINILSIGRISVTMPEILVEIKGTGFDKNEISATLDSEELVVDSVNNYDAATESTCAYILVDLSKSMRHSFDLVKRNIVSYIKNASDNDKIILITFGKKEVNTVLKGSESRDDAIKTVNNLKCDENGTLFYEALSKAYQFSNASTNEFSREYVIAFSDGIDVQKGNSTFEEAIKLYSSRSLPLYASCSKNASKEAADKFGELARASGGDFSIIGSEDEFSAFLKIINEVTIVKLKAMTNYADGKEKQLSVKVGSSQVDFNVPIIRSIPDTVAPAVESLIYDSEKDVFVISFTEAVVGADSGNAYKITNSKGEKISISGVFYSEANDMYEIKTADPVYKDTYTFEFTGIRDNSREANPLSETKDVVVEKSGHADSHNADNKDAKTQPWIWIIIAAVGILVVCAAVVIIILVTRKKNEEETNVNSEANAKRQIDNIDYVNSDQDVVKHHIITNDAVRIKLLIKTGKTSEQTIETSVVSSLIVGRSEICDIYIDDAKLSRQHFVIENENDVLYISDLQSRNGTILNGISINSRQRLNSGDRIMAGLSDIIITIIGR